MKCIVGGIEYYIAQKDIDLKKQDLGYICSINLIVKNNNVDFEISELNFTCDFCIPQKNYVIEDPIASIFAIEFNHIASSKIEVFEDDSIHWYGTADINWQEPFKSNVPFDIYI